MQFKNIFEAILIVRTEPLYLIQKLTDEEIAAMRHPKKFSVTFCIKLLQLFVLQLSKRCSKSNCFTSHKMLFGIPIRYKNLIVAKKMPVLNFFLSLPT